ncbi:hypothetical protein JCM11251_005162 [Rhodosporidiobolus azoricus]
MAPSAKKATIAAATKAVNKGKDSPIGPKKRKLACIPCRERRVRCDWPEGGGGCAACALARLRCPGEPAPKKRLKKGEQPPREGPSPVDIRMAKYQFGSAVTFHLIENHLQVANPSIPGMPYDLFRDFLKQAGGKSREIEIAAEVFCGAFVATSAAFTDHVAIIGATDLDQPFDSPLGLRVDYTPFHPIGQKRRDALEALSLNARQIFEDSNMRLRPSMEAIYAMWTMDEMVLLTGERGRSEREYVGLMCGHWRTLLGLKKKDLTEEQVEQLRGPVGVALLLLDAETAATLRQPCSVTDGDLSALVPHFSAVGATTPHFDPAALADEETGWESLGTQLVPLSLSMTALYRAFARIELPAFHIPTTLTPFYTALDSAYSTLSTAAHVIASLPPLPEHLDTAWRAFDLFSLVNQFRRSVLRLDLLAHQRVIEALLQSQKPPEPKEKPNNRGAAKGKSAIREPTPPPPPPPVLEPAGPPSPPPALLQAYAISRQRVHRAFALAAEMGKHAIETSSLANARRLAETLEVCSGWTSMRNADPATAAELCGELGIGMEMGQIFLQLLSLCSWSSHSALFLHQGLLGGLTLLNNNMPPPPCPYPPASGVMYIDGAPVRINHTVAGGGYRPGAYSTSNAHVVGKGRKARRREAKRLAEESEERERLRAMGLARLPGGGAASATSSMSGISSASTASFMIKQEAEEYVPDWSFLDRYMSPEEKVKEAARKAAAAAPGPSTSAAPLAPTVTTTSSGSSSRSIVSSMRQVVRNVAAAASNRPPASSNQVQSRLEAAAAPLFFKPSFKLRNPPSIQSVVGRATGRSQPVPPPQSQAQPMQQVQPMVQGHYPPPAINPVPYAASAVSGYPGSFPNPSVQQAHTAYPTSVPQPASYPYIPQHHQPQPLPLPPNGFAPAAHPPPPSYSTAVPSAYPHQQQQTAVHHSIFPSIPQSAYSSPAYQQQSLAQQPIPQQPSPPSQQFAPYHSSASSLSLPHQTSHPHQHPYLLPQSIFAGTPTNVLPSYPVPTPIVDSTAEALALEPLDPQTLALLASLPGDGAGDVNMGGVSPVLSGGTSTFPGANVEGHGGQAEWGMQGLETYMPQQQQHSQHMHSRPPTSGGGWM